MYYRVSLSLTIRVQVISATPGPCHHSQWSASWEWHIPHMAQSAGLSLMVTWRHVLLESSPKSVIYNFPQRHWSAVNRHVAYPMLLDCQSTSVHSRWEREGCVTCLRRRATINAPRTCNSSRQMVVCLIGLLWSWIVPSWCVVLHQNQCFERKLCLRMPLQMRPKSNLIARS